MIIISDPFVKNSVGIIINFKIKDILDVINIKNIYNVRNVIFGDRPQEYFGISMCLMFYNKYLFKQSINFYKSKINRFGCIVIYK